MDHDGHLTKGFLGCNYKESTLAKWQVCNVQYYSFLKKPIPNVIAKEQDEQGARIRLHHAEMKQLGYWSCAFYLVLFEFF